VQGVLLLFQLYLAHVLADFLFQSNWIARNKHRPAALGAQAAIHAACACVTVNVRLTPRLLIAILVMAVGHALVDFVKAHSADDWGVFAMGQAAHLVVVSLTYLWVTTTWAQAVETISIAAGTAHLYLYLSAYIGVVFGGGAFIQKVTQSLLHRAHPDLASSKPGLPSAGKYIGWVERALILTFVIAGFDAAIGFLLGAKALVRYPEIKEDSKGYFAEYFLIGTMTSVGLALVTGLAVKSIIRDFLS
jgi:hypothetical protein